jgi:orotidine-5'-phosphate decarboxylase
MNSESDAGHTLGRRFRAKAHAQKKNTMWDAKLLDVRNTMEAAVLNIVKHRNRFFTLHAQASDEALAAAAEACADTPTIPLAVTALTDLNDRQCFERFTRDSIAAVDNFAKIAYRSGIRGFVCSAAEAWVIRDRFPNAIIVTPAIRPLWAVGKDEQKRVTTPTQAAAAGADYIVVGRPISKPPPSRGHQQAAREIREELESA